MRGSVSETLIILSCLPLFVLALGAASEGGNPRRVAITIDDLPFVSAIALPDDEVRVRTEKILGHLQRRSVPAIGFVSEGKVFEGESEDPARVELLALWLEAGMELGNHTYSHLDLHGTPLPGFQEDVLRGEILNLALW